MIWVVTKIGRIICACLELVLEIVIAIHSRWDKSPSQERPSWAKSQAQRFEKQVPKFADVNYRGSRAYTQHISANQALAIKRPLPSPNPACWGKGFLCLQV